MPCDFTGPVSYSVEKTGGSLGPGAYCNAILKCGSHKVPVVTTDRCCAGPGAQHTNSLLEHVLCWSII